MDGHRPVVRTTARHLLRKFGTGGTRVTLVVEQVVLVGVVMSGYTAAVLSDL